MLGKYILGALIGGAIGVVLGYFGKCTTGTCPLTANPYRGAIYGVVMGILLTSIFVYRSKVQPEELNPQKENKSSRPHSIKESPINIDSKSDFQANVLDNSGICLVDLFSNRCPPCKVLSPTISSLAKTYAGKVTVCKVNVDRLPAIAERYRIYVIPTVLIVNKGQEAKRLIGLQPQAEYTAILDKLINENAN